MKKLTLALLIVFALGCAGQAYAGPFEMLQNRKMQREQQKYDKEMQERQWQHEKEMNECKNLKEENEKLKDMLRQSLELNDRLLKQLQEKKY